MKIRPVIVAAAIAAASIIGVGAVHEEVASASSVNCAAYIYKPDNFWRRGSWRPVNQGHRTVEEWLRACRGRVQPHKKSPNAPQGPWRVNIRLNGGNCTYTADQDLRDWVWWQLSNIVVS